ncbi:NADH:ubiquinone reductase (Na(+)-transporting) subunit C [Hyphobacterium sp. CCMP332]|nr:NADH:ubiquinone reductase (Na(+)-transporting) subunit C [Hyphobacterium sp. CCMP332]
MQQSNIYIIVFSAVLTVVLGGLLALAAVGLKPEQKKQEDLFKKKSILGAVMEIGPEDDVLKIYEKEIQSYVVDAEGKRVDEVNGEKVEAENIEVGKEFKKAPEDRLYPVFEKLNESGNIQCYILPVYGNGLWDKIYGYMAVEQDGNTLAGAVFDHISETPGLGARITEKEFQKRLVGKKIKDENGKLVGITVLKGEGNNPTDPHKIDGLSGATITSKGVQKMIYNYMDHYLPFFEKKTSGSNISMN